MPELRVNGTAAEVTADPNTPLLYVLRNHLGLKHPLRLRPLRRPCRHSGRSTVHYDVSS
jgi:aerobic-type carbon monoxide dehydrogenase small subunit (CoxS/CutS family)